MTKKADKATKGKKAKPPVQKPRVKDLDSPENHAKGVRGGAKMNDIIISS